MKKGAVARSLFFFAVCTLSYAQNGNNQPGDNDRPAVPPQGRGEIRPHAWIRARGLIGRNAGSGPGGTFAPIQVNTAYGINKVAGSLGKGATVAIVDAYDSPNAAADLNTFITYFGISCSGGTLGTFTKVNQSGASSPLPVYNSGWEVETSLDTQWVRAIAPCANIVLVEANSNSSSDLLTAVNTAATLGSVVSMSWGGGEFSGQTGLDSYFVRSGVTFLASSGDTGGVVEWPSSSPNVIGVGGTNLTLNPDNTVASETAWNGSGGGCSTQVVAIAVQQGFLPSSPACAMRGTPDVSMNGGNLSAVAVQISKQGGWFGVYGTSEAVQLWAGVIAIANGMRSTPLDGTLAALYTDAAGAPSSTLYTGNYRDITSGSAGSFSAGAGWDFITGLGSPLVNTLVPSYLAKPASAPSAPTGLVATAGNAQVSLSWNASTGATSYNVLRSTTSGSYGSPIVSGVTTTHYTDTGLANGTTYYYVVQAVNSAGTSGNSNEGSAMPCAPPAAPTGLGATGGSGQASLTWNVVSGAISYNVKRSTSSGSEVTINKSAVTTTSYTDTGLSSGTKYYYEVSAVSACGEGPNSTEVSATAAPAGPTGLLATAGNAQVGLSWNASTGASSYNVLRSTTNGGPYGNPIASVTATSYTNTGLTNGTTYYYVVQAVNSGGASGNSNQASATPQAGTVLPPTTLVASGAKRRVNLSWTQSTSAGVTQNKVYRSSTNGGPYTPIATLGATTSYSDANVTSRVTYYYVVTAVSAGVESPHSNQASATPR